VKTVFWREDPLNESEVALLDAVLKAHDASARRDNISTVNLKNAAIGSGRYTNALVAALSSIGGPHGPVLEAMGFIDGGRVDEYLDFGFKIPGWGNSFVKGQPDPIWSDVDSLLNEHWKAMHSRLEAVTKELHGAGKNVFPNPGGYTAAAALILGLPAEIASWLFVAGRLNAWSEMSLQYLRKA
jgi:citrate synthase